MLYSNNIPLATKNTASRREIRNNLRLLGGSRQDIAFQSREVAVFSGIVPAITDYPAHEVLSGSRFQSNRAVLAGWTPLDLFGCDLRD